MIFEHVKNQIDDIMFRVIETGVSLQQNHPEISNNGKKRTIGNIFGTTIALKETPYENIYTELESNNKYHIKLPDGGLIIFQYTFSETSLERHRLCFFPSPKLPTWEEMPSLYEHDEMYADITSQKIVRFPIRFDYDPQGYKPKYHANSHLTLGQFENCRIPMTHPLSPSAFLLFILRNFYHKLYIKHLNKFERKFIFCPTKSCITPAEINIPHIMLMGWRNS